MNTESAKALVRQVVEDWNRGDVAAFDEHLDPGYVNRDPSNPGVTDLASYKRWAIELLAALPDLHVRIEDMIAEGDRVAKLWSGEGTHRGELLGVAPTGRRVTWSGITIYRVAGDRVVECIWRSDALGLLQQLGVIPAGEDQTAGAPR